MNDHKVVTIVPKIFTVLAVGVDEKDALFHASGGWFIGENPSQEHLAKIKSENLRVFRFQLSIVCLNEIEVK